MKIKTSWLIIVGLVLFLPALPLSPGSAGDAEKKGPTPAMEEKKAEAPVETKAAPAPAEKLAVAEKPAGLVGRVVAVVPESRTLIVDVPRGKKALRIGATVTSKLIVAAALAPLPLPEIGRGITEHTRAVLPPWKTGR